jgi:hypothetical protein
MALLLKLLRVRFTEPAAPPRAAGEHVRLGNPWHAVSIVPGAGCCNAAREASGKRHLSSDTPPPLPLAGCTSVACMCRYRHHDDRRSARPRESLGPVGDPAPRRRADDAAH